jgi:predicted ATPase/DNA-binding CsgD family transcriptional regulator
MAESDRTSRVPHARSSLVGRDEDVARVLDLLRTDGIRLVTITGLSGVGKTSVAEEVARRLMRAEPVGVRRIRLDEGGGDRPDLASELAGPSLVEADTRPPVGRTRVLLLDGFERQLEAAPLLGEALDADPDLTLLVTSIVPLGIRGEHLVRLAPLPLVEDADPTAEDVLASPAAQLLVERIAALDPAYTPSVDDAAAIADLCRRLDGIPLALELAAARCASSGLSQVNEQLRRRSPLDVLDRGSTDAAERHRGLRRTLEWTHDLLGPDERIAFRRLGVFAGPAAWDDLVAVLAADPLDEGSAWDALSGLLTTGLVHRVEGADGDRLAMLASVRELAREHLTAAGEADGMRVRHTEHYRARAAALSERMWTPELADVRRRLQADVDEYAAAVEELRAAGRAVDAVRLLSHAHTAWVDDGRPARAGEHMRALLEQTDGELDPATEVVAWTTAADLSYWSHPDDAERAALLGRLQVAVDDALALGRTDLALRTLWTIVYLRLARGELEPARREVERAIALAEESGDERWTTRLLSLLGVVANQQGRTDEAVEKASEALRRACSDGDAWQALRSTFVLAGVAGIEHRPEHELVDLDAAIESAMEIGDVQAEGVLRVMVALSRLRAGDVPGAIDEVGRSLRICRRSGHWYVEEICVATLVLASLAAGRPEDAARLHGGLVGVFDDLRRRLSPSQVDQYLFAVEAVRSALGEDRFDELVDEGAALGWRQLLGECDRIVAEADDAAASEATGDGPAPDVVTSPLTDRELEVISLMAEGATNKEVAVRLGLRPKTVMHHAANIYRKLGVAGRTEAVSVAFRTGLLDHGTQRRDAAASAPDGTGGAVAP